MINFMKNHVVQFYTRSVGAKRSASARRPLATAVLLTVALIAQACGTDSENGVSSDPFWLQDGGETSDAAASYVDGATGDDDVGGPHPDTGFASDTDGAETQDLDTTSADAISTDASSIDTESTGTEDSTSGPKEQFFASLQLDRIVSQDPSPFGNAWKEGRTSTLGLVKVAWDGNVGTRWLHVCAMHANSVHGSQVSFSKSFLSAIPTAPHKLSRSGTTWTQASSVDLIGLKASHTGAMPGLGKSKHASLVDADKDGKPGVTVQVNVSLLGNQQIYVAQRTTSSWTAKLADDGSLSAEPKVTMEQSIVGASLSLLVAQPKEKPVSSGAPNTLRWVPSDKAMTCKELVAQASKLFKSTWPPKD
ncbi:MAG: hypothetical protein KC502_22815 [Myxococcales bacterium]|nr:hypothetical protein [Myxococcales bacterium]